MARKRAKTKDTAGSSNTKKARTGEAYGHHMRGGLEWPETLRLVGRDATVATVVASMEGQLQEPTAVELTS